MHKISPICKSVNEKANEVKLDVEILKNEVDLELR